MNSNRSGGLGAARDVCLAGQTAENCAENSVPVVAAGSGPEEFDFPVEWRQFLRFIHKCTEVSVTEPADTGWSPAL